MRDTVFVKTRMSKTLEDYVRKYVTDSSKNPVFLKKKGKLKYTVFGSMYVPLSAFFNAHV